MLSRSRRFDGLYRLPWMHRVLSSRLACIRGRREVGKPFSDSSNVPRFVVWQFLATPGGTFCSFPPLLPSDSSGLQQFVMLPEADDPWLHQSYPTSTGHG